MHETWIPFTNDTRWPNPPGWLLRLDMRMGDVMCKLGRHRYMNFGLCFYCGQDDGE